MNLVFRDYVSDELLLQPSWDLLYLPVKDEVVSILDEVGHGTEYFVMHRRWEVGSNGPPPVVTLYLTPARS